MICLILAKDEINALPARSSGRLQSASGEELRLFVGPLRALLSSVLRPSGGAFKGEL